MVTKNSPEPGNGVLSMVNANNEDDHSRMRRVFNNAFSDKALRQQEPLVRSYTDLLIQRIHEHAAEGKSMEVVTWYSECYVVSTLMQTILKRERNRLYDV